LLLSTVWQLGRGKYSVLTAIENLQGESKFREIWAKYPLEPQKPHAATPMV